MQHFIIHLFFAALACSDTEIFNNSSLPAQVQSESTEKASILSSQRSLSDFPQHSGGWQLAFDPKG